MQRRSDGTYRILLPDVERDLLRSLGPDTRRLLEDRQQDDPAVDRLFPVAYPKDDEREQEYEVLVHDELLSSHLAALRTLEETAGAKSLDQDQLEAWMRATNEIRLVLGTRLGVTQDGVEADWDESDAQAAAVAVYDYLTYLQGEIVEALSAD